MNICSVRRLWLIAISLLYIVAGIVHAQSLHEGVSAYERGDYITSLKIFTTLAATGDAAAHYGLGVMYAAGQGVKQDYRQAEMFYRLAATKGYEFAQHNLGNMFYKGVGVKGDDVEAVKWYRLAASQGNEASQFNLGNMYAKGRGVSTDYVRAFMWLDISADSGHPDALTNRELVRMMMAPKQIAAAKQHKRRCVESNFAECY